MTVSLVTYNHTLKEIRPVVDAVLRSANVETFYVVDNSGEGPLRQELDSLFSSPASRIQHPSLIYLPADNPGFGAGHNLAIRAAMAAGSRVHAVVNPDIDFRPGTLERLEAFFDASPDVGLAMPKTVYPNGAMQYNAKLLPTPLESFARRFMPTAWTTGLLRRYELRQKDHERMFDCGYLCGCFLVLRLDCLREVGLFDERFFLYPEDIDLSRRVYASANWRAVYWPGVTVVHEHTKASYRSFRMLWVHAWNMVRYFNKWGWAFDAGRRRINREVLGNCV